MEGISADQIGTQIGLSRWFTIDQRRIDVFADATEDHQFVHVDPELASNTPFGGTIAHGFLSLSMLSAMSIDALPQLSKAAVSLNYGFDRIRFTAPVLVGSRVRGRFTLAGIDTAKSGEITLTQQVEVEIEDHKKLALVATWITRHFI